MCTVHSSHELSEILVRVRTSAVKPRSRKVFSHLQRRLYCSMFIARIGFPDARILKFPANFGNLFRSWDQSSFIRTSISNVRAMGSYWSTESKNDASENKLAVQETAILSAPCAKFTDALDLSVQFSESDSKSLARASEMKATWRVELEVDVAYLRSRHTLAMIEADLQQRLHRLRIPSAAFRQVVESRAVSVDGICNVCAIHVNLHRDGRPEERIGGTTVVMDVSRDGYDSGQGIESVIRKFYGVVDRSGEEG